MKFFTIVVFLLAMPIFGMEHNALPEHVQRNGRSLQSTLMYESPRKLLRHHIQEPEFVYNELQKYPSQALLRFRYSRGNNLLHILVTTLLENKDYLEIDHITPQYKPIFEYLVKKGLDINEPNDDHSTPYLLMVKAHDERLTSLEKYLADELGADMPSLCLAPELSFIWDIMTCNSCRKQKYS